MNKPFTELPQPKRTHRLSIVAVWNLVELDAMRCEHTGCKNDDVEEIEECPVCGRRMCWMCYGQAGVKVTLPHVRVVGSTSGPFIGLNSTRCCSDCSKLTSDERQAVMELRAKIDRF